VNTYRSTKPAKSLMLVCALALPVALGGCFGGQDTRMSASAGSMAAQAAGARVTPIFVASTRR
jgi:hypothetical protein